MKLESIEELQEFLTRALQDGVWGRLLDRGSAWAVMRQAGELPADAPPFGKTIETDLAEYGFSVLRAAIASREADGQAELTRKAFEQAGMAFEAIVRNGAPDSAERGFYRVIAAAAYHLGGYSAIAYSLLSQHYADANMGPGEDALMRLILRDLDALRTHAKHWLQDDLNKDETLAGSLEADGLEMNDVVASVINSTICRALSYFDFALQTGNGTLLEAAKDMLRGGIRLSESSGAVPLWWISRLCLHPCSSHLEALASR